VLTACGFCQIRLSNLEGTQGEAGPQPTSQAIDAENIPLPDESYSAVFAHHVIHHCRSPHRAVCEMLRVAQRYVFVMEPNDSLMMGLLCRLGLSFPFEIQAVVASGYTHGGVRNSDVPNFIYRWNKHELDKLTASFLAERAVDIFADPHWDFSLDEGEIAARKETRLSAITNIIGAHAFISLLHRAEKCLNRIPTFRHQGNKFFCCIEKKPKLRPWLSMGEDGRVVFNRSFRARHPLPSSSGTTKGQCLDTAPDNTEQQLTLHTKTG
jgi:SAM-dependent methyltransferase